MKKSILFMSLALIAGSATARQISESEARAIAASKVPGLTTKAARIQSKTEPAAQNSAPIYLFNAPTGGFAIIAGDDRMPNAVLAYSDNAILDIDNCSPALKAWLEEMTQFIALGNLSRVSSPELDYSTPVAPLISTKWNQDAPFNLMTPLAPNGEHCPTGCGATAMAQVVNYWQWPKEGGIAAHSYEWEGQTLSVDFRESRYDWANMADVYDENSTEAQNNAVAQLMWECGVALDMDYGEEQSGASTFAVPCGLVDYLGYNPGMDIVNRDFTPTDEWFALVKNELDSARPIIYCGATSSAEGHAFVCDGYDESGLYHINWGWGGLCDGYFDLSSLDPNMQGIGGAASGEGFSEQQSIIINLRPAQEGDEPSLGWQLAIEDFDILADEDNPSLFSVEWEIANWGFRTFEGDLYLTFSRDGYPDDTETEVLQQFVDDNALIPNANVTFAIAGLDASELEDGIYRLQLTARDLYTGEVAEVCPPAQSIPIRFEVKDGIMIFEYRPQLEIDDIEIDEMGFFFTQGNMRYMLSTLGFSLTNTSDVWFMGDLAVTVSYPGEDEDQCIEETYALGEIPNLGPDEAIEVSLPILYNVDGKVKVSLASCSESEDREPQEVVFNLEDFEFDAEGVYCELALAQMPVVEENGGIVTITAKVGSCTGDLDIEDGLSIDEEAVTERDVLCSIYNEETDELAATAKAAYSGTWNEIKTLTFTTAEALENGSYYAELTYLSAPDASGNALELTLGDEVEDFPGITFSVVTSGIDDMVSDNASAVVYSVFGQRMSPLAKLAPGCYISVRGGKAQKIIVK